MVGFSSCAFFFLDLIFLKNTS
ncbi:hypothetical protein RDI58_001271 [Solanum bulbocastanum]|uniref:Uncharacterized protein n=1 Tax=Solanum bulbocastanum TaxID=147425 RepID=A0AAN8UDQ9_SOLBU